MFLLHLARELRMTVSQLLDSTTSADITEWQAYFRIQNTKEETTVDDKLHAAFGGPK